MAPQIPSAKLSLSYPAYCCDFDPQDANRLIVAGGGGAGRTGVSNKISVLDVSSPDRIEVASELELSRDEDSVTALAAGLRKNRTTLVYAGINSSLDSIQKGKNEHFRVFGVDQPARSRSNSTHKITELSRSALFTTHDADTYQRLLRVAPSYSGTHQVGAVATGLAKTSEIAIFDVSTAAGAGVAASPKLRGRLELAKEAMDLDVIQVADDKWQLAYCHDFVLNTLDIAKAPAAEPANIFTTPVDIATGRERPQFRCIRYLTPHFLLAASNMHQGSGVVLQGFRLPADAAAAAAGKAKLAVSARLPKTATRATCLAVRNLSPPASPGARQGDAQFVVAVAAQDSSITLYTLEHTALAGLELLAKLHPITTLRAVHASPISGLAFSHVPPAPPIPTSSTTLSSPPPTTSSPTSPSTRPLSALKLASVGSMGATAALHTLPLRRLAAPRPRAPGAPPGPRRYAVALRSRGPGPAGIVLFAAVVFALLGALLQGVLEVGGLVEPAIGARSLVPRSWVRPRVVLPAVRVSGAGLGRAEGLGRKKALGLEGVLAGAAAAEGEKVVLSVAEDGDADGEHGGVKVDVHDEERHGDARSWEDLPAEQKRAWRERLQRAGRWGGDMGETLFKGVLFSEIGGAIGQMVGG